MNKFQVATAALVCGAVFGLCGISSPALAAEDASPDVIKVSLQVQAMQKMRDWAMTAEQKQALKALGTDTADPRADRKATKLPDKYAEALDALREALGKEDNDEEINEKQSDLDDTTNGDDPGLDNQVDITPAARTKAATFLKCLTATQLAAFIAQNVEETPEPAALAIAGLDEVREAKPEEVEMISKAVVDDVATAVEGLDLEKSKELRRQVGELLQSVRAMSNDDFTNQRPELEKTIHKLVAGADPMNVLRHWIERDLASLLSNPQLSAAIEASPKSTPTPKNI